MASHLHFPVLFGDRCVKRIGQSRVEQQCGQSVNGDRHLYYRCRRSGWCGQRFLSIESRLGHEAEPHDTEDPVEGYR